MSDSDSKPGLSPDDNLTDEDIAKAPTSELIALLAAFTIGRELHDDNASIQITIAANVTRVSFEIDRRLPGPKSQLGFPAGVAGVTLYSDKGDVDDQLATAAALLELTARTFAQRDAAPASEREVGDVGLGVARADLRKAAVVYAKAEQKFGVELLRMLGKDAG